MPAAKPCQIRGAEAVVSVTLRPDDGQLQNVGLQLQERIVHACPAVDAQFGQRCARVLLHRLGKSATWKCDAVERCSRDVGRRRTARDAEDRARGRTGPNAALRAR